jgi:hypothetical protein
MIGFNLVASLPLSHTNAQHAEPLQKVKSLQQCCWKHAYAVPHWVCFIGENFLTLRDLKVVVSSVCELACTAGLAGLGSAQGGTTAFVRGS